MDGGVGGGRERRLTEIHNSLVVTRSQEVFIQLDLESNTQRLSAKMPVVNRAKDKRGQR